MIKISYTLSLTNHTIYSRRVQLRPEHHIEDGQLQAERRHRCSLHSHEVQPYKVLRFHTLSIMSAL